MYNIKTLNSISPVWQGILSEEDYLVSDQNENMDAIIVRSADMHGQDYPDSLLCVGRAGAGVNNIPVEEMEKKGIVVFNTPGANANAVKELVLTGLLLAGRDVVGGIEWVQTQKEYGQDVMDGLQKDLDALEK